MTAYCRLTHDEIKFEGATCWVCALVKKNAELEEKLKEVQQTLEDVRESRYQDDRSN